ncbi:MAG: alpha/beta fold hydrolase [Chloroflexi bacterium]|nr:MAG: alpha/beta fold hydrolase [Chloroflexota bacterium]TMF97705.1 MAG: alpha/beta fold hydrolase [Chloroflexota bacterium]
MKPRVICVPGSVAPAAQRYKPLLDGVAGEADLHLKDLEVYREAKPPAGYSIDEELSAVDRLADGLGLDRFHLLGYSGGGFISLAYAGTRPKRILSLSLFEPAQIPGTLTEAEEAFFAALRQKLDGLEGDQFMAAFVREQVKPGAVLAPPPPGPVSPEMQKRPAGIAALIRAFEAYEFDREMLRAAPFPVFYGYGDLSHPEQALKAGILAQLFADIRVHRYAGVHHFVPPEMIYTPDHVRLLLEHWRRAEELVPQLP